MDVGGIVYHVLNRRVGRLPIFEKDSDYAAFVKILNDPYSTVRLSGS